MEGRESIDIAPPIIVDDLGAQTGGVLGQGKVKELAALQRLFLEHALAKTVDGEDRSQIHVEQGQFQAMECQRLSHTAFGKFGAPGCKGRINPCSLPQALFLWAILSPPYLAKQIPGRGQSSSDPLFQLFRGRLGKGHHQDTLQGKTVFGHKTEDQHGNGKGLAGSGAGFHQIDPLAQRGGGGVKCLLGNIHGCCSPAAQMGPRNSSHRRRNSGPSKVSGRSSAISCSNDAGPAMACASHSP